MNIIEALEVAIRTERTVVFSYNGEKRTFNAEELASRPENRSYVTGYDTIRKDTRRFSLAKMSDITVL
jgi:predicted DNA-binding transcriptional regulator YafY